MAREENRTQSIARLQASAIRKVKVALKERGIAIPDIEGPSDESDLRNLQEWQAIANAFDEANKAAENPAQAGNSAVGSVSYGGSTSPDSATPDSGKASKGKAL